MEKCKKPYVGQISHSGVQKVTAPYNGAKKRGNAKVIKAGKSGDLRNGK